MLRHQWSHRWLLLPAVLLGLVAGLVPAASAMAVPPTAPPLLVDIRAAHHETYDRIVFEFAGGLPEHQNIGYVDQVVDEWSGNPVAVIGNAFLSVSFFPAVGHEGVDQITYGPVRRSYALPNIMQVVRSSDWEYVLGFGIGLAAQRPFTVSTLTSPSRVVIDIDTSFTTVPVQDTFIQRGTLATVAVTRPVVPPATAKGALQRLFAGPTQAEIAAGLTFITSGVTGFTNLGISEGIARVTLTGDCNTRGVTTTIADELMPTLKQFPSVQWVKIYDESGQTDQPSGNSDSLPPCL